MNNSTVGHNFIYGENGKGSSFYSENNGTVLYSYSSILALRFNDIIVISEKIGNYSNSSCKHRGHLLSAIPSNYKIIWLNDIDSKYMKLNHINKNHLKNTNDNLIDLMKKQKRATKADYSYQINKALLNGDLMIKYGKIDKRSAEYKLFQKIKNGINLDDLVENSIKAEKLANKKRALKEFDNKKKRFEDFTGIKCPYSATELNFNYLKIKDDKLCTSGYICVDLKAALILYKAFINGKNIVGQKIDFYTILKANDKFVEIGCHKILVKELKRVLDSFLESIAA